MSWKMSWKMSRTTTRAPGWTRAVGNAAFLTRWAGVSIHVYAVVSGNARIAERIGAARIRDERVVGVRSDRGES